MSKLRIGLTGGIGSGKTTVANLFAKKRIDVIDADQLSRELTAPNTQNYQKILHYFGKKVLENNGELNRIWLRQFVFEHKEARDYLENLLHSQITGLMQTKANQAASSYIILAIPLLAELEYLVSLLKINRILVIDAPEKLCRARVRERDHLSDRLITKIFRAQASREARLQKANDSIFNADSLDDLEKNVDKMHRFYSNLVLASIQ